MLILVMCINFAYKFIVNLLIYICCIFMRFSSFSMDSQSIDQQKGRGRNKHNWTSAEDEKLVEAMVELCVSGTMKSDNGFKPGTFVQIEKLLEQKLPGSGIKASPHIESRVKTLKKQYNAISDMIVTSSGFSWNDEKKMIICEKDLYDGWVKVSYFFILFSWSYIYKYKVLNSF